MESFKWKANIELAQAQAEDPDFKDIIAYLLTKQLPTDPKAKEIVEKSYPKYELRKNLLYRVDLTQE